MSDQVLKTLRGMAWERAKGELLSIGQTFWGEMELFEKWDAELKRFIKEVEDRGLCV